MGSLQGPFEFTAPAGISDSGEPIAVGKRDFPAQCECAVGSGLTPHGSLKAVYRFIMDLTCSIMPQCRQGMDVIDRDVEDALGPKRRFRSECPPGKRRAFRSDEKGALCEHREISLRVAGLMLDMPRFCHDRHSKAPHRQRIDAHAGTNQRECAEELSTGERLAHWSDNLTCDEGVPT